MVFHSYADANGEQKRLKEKVLEVRKMNEYVDGQIDPVMLFQMALCNDVLNASKGGVPTYQGASPDEVAFVVAAQKFGLELRSRNVDSVNYAFLYKGTEFLITFHCYGTIPFSSDRKKMSILLQECGMEKDSHALETLPFAHQKDGKWYLLPEEIAAPGEAFVLTKGADSFMYPICLKADQQTQEEREHAASEFSKLGLRTLVFSSRSFDGAFLEEWAEQFSEIKQHGESSPEYSQHTQQLESSQVYSGMTAIEDELQNDLQPTLQFLIQSGLRIWMLTGDKSETAVNIGKSSGLSGANDTLFSITSEVFQQFCKGRTESEEELLKQMLTQFIEDQKKLYKDSEEAYNAMQESIRANFFKTETKCQKVLKAIKNFFTCGGLYRKPLKDQVLKSTVVLDVHMYNMMKRHSLEYLFFTLAYNAKSTICCRLLPSDKAQIVSLCHKCVPEMTTMAIGDGANDVAMIKMAQIGVGVAGKEGMDSCNNADITLPEFKYLKRAIVAYGHMSHLRVSEAFEYYLEKNSVLAIMHIVYSFYNLMSVQMIIDSLLLTMFNLLITNFTILFQSMIERDMDIEIMMKYPQVFKQFELKYRPNSVFTSLRLLKCVYYSVVVILLSKYITGDQTIFSDGTVNDLNAESLAVFCGVLFGVTIEYFIHTNYYTFFMLGSIIFMFVVVAVCLWLGTYSNGFGTTSLGVGVQVSGSLHFHMHWLLVGMICCLPSIFYQMIKRMWFPSTSDVIRFQTKSMGCVDPRRSADVEQATHTPVQKIVPAREDGKVTAQTVLMPL